MEPPVTNQPTPSSEAGVHGVNPWSGPTQGDLFFENDEVRMLRDRALEYARAGVPVHFSGPAGLGKTSLAFDVARQLGRKISVMTGNNWLSAQDFVGGRIGSTSSTVVDRYVHSVQRTEKETRDDWGTSLLAQAMVHGHTLIYDEFTRATPEANATLLSVLEEGLLICTDPAGPQRYTRAHPDFRVLLTSNPHDYVAVNSAPDALLDRVVTLPMQAYSPKTVAMIVEHRTQLAPGPAMRLAKLLTSLHEGGKDHAFSVLRTALLVGRIAAYRAKNGGVSDAELSEITTIVLTGRGVSDAIPEPSNSKKQIAAE